MYWDPAYLFILFRTSCHNARFTSEWHRHRHHLSPTLLVSVIVVHTHSHSYWHCTIRWAFKVPVSFQHNRYTTFRHWFSFSELFVSLNITKAPSFRNILCCHSLSSSCQIIEPHRQTFTTRDTPISTSETWIPIRLSPLLVGGRSFWVSAELSGIAVN